MPLDTELHKAAHKGDIQGVKDLVESGEIDVNEKGAQDRTALHRAAGANHVSIIHFLLQAGAPVDCVDRCRRTPLHWAAISGHLDATQLLLDSGGDLRCKTMSGMNPLMCAVQQRWHSVAEAILEWSAGCAEEVENGQTPSPAELCSTTDADGKTAFVFAKEHGDASMQKLLKSFAPKKPSGSCCGGGKGQLAAAVLPPGDRAARAGAGADTATTAVSNTYAGIKAAGGDDGGYRDGWLRRVCCFARCCGTSTGDSGLSGTPSGATVVDSAPSNSAPLETAAVKGCAVGKVDESHGSAATGVDGVRNIVAASDITNVGDNLPRPAAGEDSRPNSAPKDKRGSRGGAGGEGAKKSSGGSHRRRRDGHAGGGGDVGASEGTQVERRPRKSRSGGGSGVDPSRSRRKDEREGGDGSGAGGSSSRRTSRRTGGGGAGTVAAKAEGSEAVVVAERDCVAATPFFDLNGKHEHGHDGVGDLAMRS
eukprot:g9030.t2